MQKKPHKIGIVWFRNDLRVRDQEALYQAAKQCEGLLGVYCFDPRQFGKTPAGFAKTGPFRAAFLIQAVADLRESLYELGIPLLIRSAKPEDALPEIARSVQARAIFASKAFTEEELRVEQALSRQLTGMTTLKRYYTDFLLHPDDLPFAVANLPEVFTAFRKEVEKRVVIRPELGLPEAQKLIPSHSAPGEIPSLEALSLQSPAPDPRSAFPFPGGEKAAWQRLDAYVWETEGIASYKETRNGLIGTEYSAKFSPWLAHGCLSARSIWHEVKRFEREVRSNSSTYWMIFELLWRDYFRYISLKWGNAIFQHGGIKGTIPDSAPDPRIFDQWRLGKTGQPFIDANMRELSATGWMSNRGRQNVASYLVRDLRQPWWRGAEWFESLLLDYDPSSNWGNWNYVAGIGNDPRENRYFNPQTQAERYDPAGEFVRLWGEND